MTTGFKPREQYLPIGNPTEFFMCNMCGALISNVAYGRAKHVLWHQGNVVVEEMSAQEAVGYAVECMEPKVYNSSCISVQNGGLLCDKDWICCVNCAPRLQDKRLVSPTRAVTDKSSAFQGYMQYGINRLTVHPEYHAFHAYPDGSTPGCIICGKEKEQHS